MISLNYFIDRIKDVKLEDYVSLFSMTVAWMIKPLFRSKYSNVWLVCEEPMEARDNGYHFFKYMCLNHSEQKCIYAIRKNSVDYIKVDALGETIRYGGIRHWLTYFLCEYNISSQKGGKPNAALCSFMELNNIFCGRNIFLQHGVTINDVRWLYADRTKINKFITSTIPETEFIISKFGYPKEDICLTGMPRFDALHDIKLLPKRVLIMPTWRYWFNLKSKQKGTTDTNFETSEYLNRWMELLAHPELNKMIQKFKLEVLFYPHRNMQSHINDFKKINSKVIIASWEKYDIQELLKTSAIIITDYSSVFFDMAYMKKPTIFYQFDEDKYRKYQYEEGYFNYHHNVFGNAYMKCEDVLADLEKKAEDGFKPSSELLEEHKRIFKYWDVNNSERIFKILKNNGVIKQ